MGLPRESSVHGIRFWSPHLKNNRPELEKVQRKASKMTRRAGTSSLGGQAKTFGAFRSERKLL